ncbi:SDR family oxidoreductase [Streptomyces morookaense]|uniref:SDR family oxidoreductase n=1 Tax=Streptomyces morookaense TaxID=1970 RepID=UPI0033F738F7
MDLGLKDKVYVLTGASRGLGFAAARELAADGARLVVSGRDGDAAARAAASLGTDAVGVAADNADPAAAGRLVATARERFGRLDGVLISVGGPPPGSAEGNDDDQWRAAFESVFLGAVRLARTAAEAMGEGGVIGFVLSSSVYEPVPGLTISNGLRPGLAGFAKSLAVELGPRGIRVVGLLPARIETDRVRELDALSGDSEAARARHEARIPLGRYGAPEEFGRVAAFLLSPAASYLTGVMVPVDGGARQGI